ncbi:hypothetical protein ACLOJK_029750 [Asimina triloba]
MKNMPQEQKSISTRFDASGSDEAIRTQNQDPEDLSVKSGRNSLFHQDPIRTPDVNPDCVSGAFRRAFSTPEEYNGDLEDDGGRERDGEDNGQSRADGGCSEEAAWRYRRGNKEVRQRDGKAARQQGDEVAR